MARERLYARIDDQLKLDEVRWRYFQAGVHYAVWTTERLYDGGDYLAALLDRELNVVHKRYEHQRQLAKAQARRWYSIYSSEYVIREEP